MSLDKISAAITDIVAIKNYPILQQQVTDLESEGKALRSDYQFQGDKLTECEKTIAEQREQARVTSEALAKSQSEVEQANKKAEDIQSRVVELESLKASTDGKTLEEVTRALLEARRKEVENAANARFQAMKTAWETKEKSDVIRKASLELLSEIMFSIGNHTIARITKDVLDSGMIREVENMIDGRARIIANEIDVKKVETASELAANEELRRKIEVEWPRFLKENVVPIATEISSQMKNDVLGFLTGEILLPCMYCAKCESFMLAPEHIAILLEGRRINILPPKEVCGVKGTEHRYYPPRLEDIIEAKLVGEYRG